MRNPMPIYSEDTSDVRVRVIYGPRGTAFIDRTRAGTYVVGGDFPDLFPYQGAELGEYRTHSEAVRAAQAATKARKGGKSLAPRSRRTRNNPVREVQEGESTRYYVTDTKFFLTRERAEAWLAAHPEGASAPRERRTRTHTTEEEAIRSSLPRRRAGERLLHVGRKRAEQVRAGILSAKGEAFLPDPLLPSAPYPAGYGGVLFPTIEHAYTAAMLGPDSFKRVKNMSVAQAVEARAFVRKPDKYNEDLVHVMMRPKLPKGFDPASALDEIIRSSFRNINRRSALTRVKQDRIVYENEGQASMRPATGLRFGTVLDEMPITGWKPGLLLGEDNLYGDALTRYRDAIAAAGPLGRV